MTKYENKFKHVAQLLRDAFPCIDSIVPNKDSTKKEIDEWNELVFKNPALICLKFKEKKEKKHLFVS
jgi:hypothetical protein